MKTNKLFYFSLLAILSTSLLAGCGSTATEQSTSALGVQPSATAPANIDFNVASNTNTNSDAAAANTNALRQPDVVYVPTPQDVVDEMLRIAEVKEGDILYDLGSGDGRIPITAAQRFKVRGVGIEINPDLIAEANRNAADKNVSNLVTFRNADLFESDFSEATVVTLYLLDSLNEKLRPKLLRELKPGTRIVSHAFRMGDWKPEKSVNVGSRTVYFWRVPERTAPAR